MNELNQLPPCAEFEHEIVELHEGSLAPARTVVVRAHVESCARCRAWQSAFAELDTGLAAALPRPALAADFAAKLAARIRAETHRAPAAELRITADGEYQRMLEALRQGARRSALVAGVTLVAAALTGIALAPALMSDAASVLSFLSMNGRMTVFGSLGGAIALAALAWSAMQGVLPAGLSRA